MSETDKLIDETWGIFFESETARVWVIGLIKRADQCLERSKTIDATGFPPLLRKELTAERQELTQARSALVKAASALRMFEGAVQRREMC